MAIDMTTVKAISYNNKDVIKIEDSLGRTLWQASSGPSVVTYTITPNVNTYSAQFSTFISEVNTALGTNIDVTKVTSITVKPTAKNIGSSSFANAHLKITNKSGSRIISSTAIEPGQTATLSFYANIPNWVATTPFNYSSFEVYYKSGSRLYQSSNLVFSALEFKIEYTN